MARSHIRPSYRYHQGDPEWRLLTAVVYRAVRDCVPGRSISAKDRESAR